MQIGHRHGAVSEIPNLHSPLARDMHGLLDEAKSLLHVS